MPTIPLFTFQPQEWEEEDWKEICQILEQHLLPRLDEAGVGVFLPTPLPPPPGSIVTCRAMPALVRTYPRHQIAFLYQGQDNWWVEGQWLTFSAGEGMWLPPHFLHMVHVAVNAPPPGGSWLWIDVMSFGVIVHRCRITPHLHDIGPLHTLTDSRLVRLFQEWQEEMSQPERRRSLAAKGLLLALFDRLPTAPRLKVPTLELPANWENLPETLQMALHRLHRTYYRPFRLLHLAQACFVSPYHLCRLFRRHLNTTPLAYLTRLRMAVAYQLLRETTLSVAEVASRVGYASSPTHFTRLFLRTFGLLPRALRTSDQPSTP